MRSVTLCLTGVLLAVGCKEADCSTTERPLTEYCESSDCEPLEAWSCESMGFAYREVRVGCGYISFSFNGDVKDVWGRVYEEGSGSLVHAWRNEVDFDRFEGCHPVTSYGQDPECADWVDPCSNEPDASTSP